VCVQAEICAVLDSMGVVVGNEDIQNLFRQV
jgi:hypothetical protein